jgi:hypothetical protein
VRRPADRLPPADWLLVEWGRPERFDHHLRRLVDYDVTGVTDVHAGKRAHELARRLLATGLPRDDGRTGSPGNVLDDHRGVRDHLLVDDVPARGDCLKPADQPREPGEVRTWRQQLDPCCRGVR